MTGQVMLPLEWKEQVRSSTSGARPQAPRAESLVRIQQVVGS